MNTINAYRLAIEEAERFIIKARFAINDLEKDKWAKYSNKNVASAKRSSMDLSRILVEIRKPYNE